MKLKLSIDELREYTRQNRLAMSLNHIATQDYMASRCCLLNGLLSQGFILAEQSVEKKLKCILLLIDPSINIKKYNKHQIEPIIQKIQEYKDYKLTQFQTFGKRLSDIYELTRYPDNKLSTKISSWSLSSPEVNLVDEFFFYLIRISPIPDEIKFRSGLYVILCDESINSNVMRMKYWAIERNNQYLREKEKLEFRYKEVFQHFYGNSK